MIDWMYFPASDRPPPLAFEVVQVFSEVEDEIRSDKKKLNSNQVLAYVRPGLEAAGFRVETGKKKKEKIYVPVLFGRQGKPAKAFEADAYSESGRIVLEVEAGRAVVNNQFLKDLFQACMMHDVDYLGLAVRTRYRKSNDYERMLSFFETLYASQRLDLPLKGILTLGY